MNGGKAEERYEPFPPSLFIMRMLNDLYASARQALGDLATNVSDGARERSLEMIDDWLTIFPDLATYGLSITSFAMSLALSPSLNVELLGSHEDWSDDAIAERLKLHKGETAITMVLSTIRTAYRLQARTQCELRDPLILKIVVKVPPEVRVVLGHRC